MKKSEFIQKASDVVEIIFRGESFGACNAISWVFKEKASLAFGDYAKRPYQRNETALWLSDNNFFFWQLENYGYRILVWGDFVDYCIKTKLYKEF